MLSRLHELIKAKNILILGFGREGRSTLNRILEVGDAASITIADGNEALTLPEMCIRDSSYTDATATTPKITYLGFLSENNNMVQGLTAIAYPKVLDLNVPGSQITVGLTVIISCVYFSQYLVCLLYTSRSRQTQNPRSQQSRSRIL